VDSHPLLTFIPGGCRSLVQEDLKKYKMPHLRHCVSAGEPLNEEVIYNWEEATGIVIKGQAQKTMTRYNVRQGKTLLREGGEGFGFQ
jgi:hypothetical protein